MKDFVNTCVSTNVKKPLPYAAPRPPLFLNNFKDPLSRVSQKLARAWNLRNGQLTDEEQIT